MKYSICDFSQSEVTKFNDSNPEYALDPTDLLIFQWFIDFAAVSNIPRSSGSKSKGMWKKIVDDTEYFYIKYDALIDEFPILGYQSIRQIQRRFDKYVASGLLCKKVFHEGRKGSFSYFGFTEKLFSLKYDENNTSQKLNPHQTEKQSANKSNQNDKSETVTDDRNVMSKTVTDDRNVMSKTVTDDKNVMCFKRNSTTNLRNSATNSSSFTDTREKGGSVPAETEAEASLRTKTNELFGYEVSFQPDPFSLLVYRLNQSGIPEEKWGDYLSWAFNYLSERVKNKESFDGYFYRSFTQYALINKYNHNGAESSVTEKAANELVTCPVCGYIHGRFEDCTNCGLSQSAKEDEDAVRLKRLVWNLPENTRSEYNSRLQKITEKYFALGIKAITNAEIRSQQKKEICELNAEYGIA